MSSVSWNLRPYKADLIFGNSQKSSGAKSGEQHVCTISIIDFLGQKLLDSERELKTVQLSANRFSCIAVLGFSLVSFPAITFCVTSQRVFIVVVIFVIDSIRKLLNTPSYVDDLYTAESYILFAPFWWLWFFCFRLMARQR
jgi:hypothetical protein